jgi:hypothetical protein
VGMTDLFEYAGPREGARDVDPHPAQAAILTTGLVRRFGSLVAVDGIDLKIARGEIYGFLGPNGAGKSTLVRVLCTLLRPSAGRALIAGHDVVDEPQEVRFRIGVALQEAALDDRQSGRELLCLQGRLYGLRSARDPDPAGRGARPRRHRRGDRPPHRDVLGGDEASARSGRRPDAQPGGPLPGRTDHRAGSDQPRQPCGRRCGGSTPSWE